MLSPALLQLLERERRSTRFDAMIENRPQLLGRSRDGKVQSLDGETSLHTPFSQIDVRGQNEWSGAGQQLPHSPPTDSLSFIDQKRPSFGKWRLRSVFRKIDVIARAVAISQCPFDGDQVGGFPVSARANNLQNELRIFEMGQTVRYVDQCQVGPLVARQLAKGIAIQTLP